MSAMFLSYICLFGVSVTQQSSLRCTGPRFVLLISHDIITRGDAARYKDSWLRRNYRSRHCHSRLRCSRDAPTQRYRKRIAMVIDGK